jgi:hypothetical protein
MASQALIAAWRSRLLPIRSSGGKIVVWGAGAKGISFTQTLDPARDLIAALADINPGKQGRFIAVTGHPVVRPDDLPSLRPTHVVVMNPVYAREIELAMSALDLVVELVPIHSVKP